MDKFSLLCFIFFSTKFEILDAGFSKDLVRQAAKKCCSPNRQECCEDMIRFGKPIRCGYEKNAEALEQVYNCTQAALFPDEPEKRMSLDDSLCCLVFGSDQNDKDRRCESVCKTTMQSPSLDSAARLQRIQSCSLVDNVLFKCFVKCRDLRRNGFDTRVLRFDDYCNSTYLQKHI